MLQAIAIFELHQATICKAIDMKMIFFLMEIELIFTTKVLDLVSFWQWEFLELRNAPFKTSGSHLARLCSKENFREPLRLPSILAKVPRPQSWPPNKNFGDFALPNIPAGVPRPPSWLSKYIWWWRSILYAHSFFATKTSILSYKTHQSFSAIQIQNEKCEQCRQIV